MTNSISVQHVSPAGQISFIEEMPQSGLIYIGSAATDAIKIQANGYSSSVAVLDLIQDPPLLTCLVDHLEVSINGVGQALDAPIFVTGGDELSIEGHTLLVLGSSSAAFPVRSEVKPPSAAAAAAVSSPDIESATAATPTNSTALSGTLLPVGYDDSSLGTDETSKIIVTRMPERMYATEVENEVEIEFTITNGGMLVGTFETEVVGLNPDWVSIDKPSLNLFEGQKATIRVTVRPNRSYESTAGEDYFSIWVTSSDYPEERAAMYATLDIAPFREFTIGDMSPRDQTIRYRKNAGRVKFDVMNRGNVATDFLVKGSDSSQAIRFMFHMDDGMSYGGQAELRLAPGQKQQLDLELLPKERKFFAARRQRHNFNVGVSILNGLEPPAERMGQANQSPLVGLPLMMLILFCCFALLAYSFRPRIRDFGAVAADFPAEQVSAGSFGSPQFVNIGGFVMNVPSARNVGAVVEQTIAAGESVDLAWDAPIFTQILIEPGLGKMDERSGSISVSPLDTTVYTITASNIISDLLPNLFGQSSEIRVVVEPIFPVVRMSVDQEDILVGEEVEVEWSVSNADEAFIVIDGAAETIPSEQHRSKRKITLQEDSTIAIKAINRYTDANGVSKSTQIVVAVPTPTPLPPVVLNSFNVEPSVVTKGESVQLTWNVEGADSVVIEPLGEYPAQGSVEDVPQESIAYVLKATNGQEALDPTLREVTVNLPPTPTPAPGAPSIELFTISPDTVEKGSDAAKNVQLAWSVLPNKVDDDVTVEISGGNLGQRTGLPLQGNLVFEGDADSEYTLTAANEGLKSSQSVNLSITVPAPVITLLTPGISDAVGETSLSVKISGNNFVDGAKAQVAGQDRPTTFISSTELVVTMLASDLEKAAGLDIGVVNPVSAGGAVSNTSKFDLQHPVPTLSSITPPSMVLAPGNVVDYVISLTGSGYIASSVVTVNGTPVETIVGSSGQLSATIPANNLGTATELSVAVLNEAPGGGASSSATFTVNNPVPEMFSFTPAVVDVGDGPLTVQILGENFVPESVVRFDGQESIANYISSGVMELQLLPEQVYYAPNDHSILITNPPPGGGNALTTTLSPSLFTVNRQNTTTTITQLPSLYNGTTPVVGEPVSIQIDVIGANGNLAPEGEVKLGLAGINGLGTPEVTLANGTYTYTFENGLIPNASNNYLDVTAQYLPNLDPENFFASVSTTERIELDPAFSGNTDYVVYNGSRTDIPVSNVTQGKNVTNSGSANSATYTLDGSSSILTFGATAEGYVDSNRTVTLSSLGSNAKIDTGQIRWERTNFASPSSYGVIYTGSSQPYIGQVTVDANGVAELNMPTVYMRLGESAINSQYIGASGSSYASGLEHEYKITLRDKPVVNITQIGERFGQDSFDDTDDPCAHYHYSVFGSFTTNVEMWTLAVEFDTHTYTRVDSDASYWYECAYGLGSNRGNGSGTFFGEAPAFEHGDIQIRIDHDGDGTWEHDYGAVDFDSLFDHRLDTFDRCFVQYTATAISNSKSQIKLFCSLRWQRDYNYPSNDPLFGKKVTYTQDNGYQPNLLREGAKIQLKFVPDAGSSFGPYFEESESNIVTLP